MKDSVTFRSDEIGGNASLSQRGWTPLKASRKWGTLHDELKVIIFAEATTDCWRRLDRNVCSRQLLCFLIITEL